MNIIKKIFIGLIVFFIGMVLVYSTYIYRHTSSFSIPKYEQLTTGFFKVTNNEGTIQLQNTDQKTANFYQANTFDSVFYIDGNVEQAQQKISLDYGIYIIDFNSIHDSYTIEGKNFRINTQGPNHLYIDSNPEKTLIFSMDTIATINLLNNKKAVINTAYLYPHMYLLFSNNKLERIKNVDLMRILQFNKEKRENSTENIFSDTRSTFKLLYFPENIFNDNSINPIFRNRFFRKSMEEKIHEIFMIFYQQKTKAMKDVQIFKNSNIGILNGNGYISRYSQYFLNNNKKRIYLKNALLSRFANIINTPNKQPSQITTLFEKIHELQQLDNSDSQEILDIYSYYIKLLLISPETTAKDKIFFSKLAYKILEKKALPITDNWIQLSADYNYFDMVNTRKLYNQLDAFTLGYKSNSLPKKQLSYFIYFLNEIILHSLEKDSDVDITNILNIFNQYVQISRNYYNGNNFSDKQDEYTKSILLKTGIKRYEELSRELLKILKKAYIEKRDANNLFVIKEGISIDLKKIGTLKQNMNKIFSFYQINRAKTGSWGENNVLQQNYKNLQKDYKEIFLAITDHQNYLLQYKKTGIKHDSLVIKETLTKNKAGEFLSQFSNISMSDAKISLQKQEFCKDQKNQLSEATPEEAYCYKIDDLIIGEGSEQRIVSFILDPNNWNTIYNIRYKKSKEDTEKLYTGDPAYPLDSLLQNMKGAGKYGPEDLLYILFTEKKIIFKEETQKKINDKQEITEESTIMRIFKNAKLTGKRGDFNILEGFIDIQYNDVTLTEGTDGFDIRVHDADMKYELGDKTYYAILESEYIFGDKHMFVNPSIVIIDGSRNEQYGGSRIQIKGEFPIQNMKQDFKKIFEILENIDTITKLTENFYGVRTFSISFDATNLDPKKQIVYFKSDNLEISNSRNVVTKIIKDGEKLNSRIIPIDKLEDFFTSLKEKEQGDKNEQN